MTFSVDGTASGGFKKRPGSQKRAFQKVDARDLAGKWCSCAYTSFVPLWPLSTVFCTTQKALDEDRYEVSEISCCLCLPCSDSGTRTRKYVNGHATNGFALDGGYPRDVYWHRDPGCAAGNSFSKKLC